MNLYEIQPFFLATLKAYVPFAAIQAACILADDGTYPKTPGREAALNGKGICITVWDILPDAVNDAALAGASVVGIYVPVVIETNVTQNASASGAQIVGTQALQHVMQALAGHPRATPGRLKFALFDPPFQNFGKINGVNRIVANFVVPFVLTPA